MKKKEYRKIIKNERHITYRNAWHLGCITCYFVMILLITTLLVFLNELPIKPFFVIYFLAALFIGIPTIIIDQLNDKQMEDGMKYYEENNKTKDGVDYVGYLKVIEFISMMLLIISLITIYFRFLKYDYKEILLGDMTSIKANKIDIDNALDIYVPIGFKTTKDNLAYKPEDNIEYSITYEKDDTYIGIYFTNTDLKESEVYNYASSLGFYYKENDGIEVSDDLNTISFIDDDQYYYISYYSYKDKLVQVTYSCDEDDINIWEQGFVTINNNINFK